MSDSFALPASPTLPPGAQGTPATQTTQPTQTTLNGPEAGPSTPRATVSTLINGTSTTNGTHTEVNEDEANQPMDLEAVFAARREEEMARRDRSLAEFLVMLDGYKPLIPEEVTAYYLQKAGFDCSDPRLKRLLSLSAQKFISDLSRDAFHFAKLRVNGTAPGRGRPAAGTDRSKVVLTMDDLSLALGEHGVNLKKPDYYL